MAFTKENPPAENDYSPDALAFREANPPEQEPTETLEEQDEDADPEKEEGGEEDEPDLTPAPTHPY